MSEPEHDDREPTYGGNALILASTEADTWTLILGAIGVGVAGLIAWFSKSLREIGDVFVSRLKKRALGQAKHIGTLEEKVMIYREIDHLVRLKSVERVLIFVGQNGGGIPTTSATYNIGCTYGRSTDPMKRPDEDYRGPLRVDTHYLEMLLKIYRDRQVTVETATMPVGAMLREYYLAEGVTYSRLYFLSLSPTKLRYMSVAKYSEGDFSPADAHLIDSSVNRIRGLMGEED